MSPAVRTTGPKGLRNPGSPDVRAVWAYPPLNGPHPAGTDADAGARQRIAGGELTTATWGLRATASWRRPNRRTSTTSATIEGCNVPTALQNTNQAVGTHPSPAVAGPAKPRAQNPTIQANQNPRECSAAPRQAGLEDARTATAASPMTANGASISVVGVTP